MRVIGLTGKARAGKDTASRFIEDWCEENGFEFERAAFANKLKVSAAAALGFEGTTGECVAFCNLLKREDAYITVRCPLNLDLRISGREFLQRYGTEAHREVFGTEFWVNALLDEALPHGADDPRFSAVLVISDVRFNNEARAVHNAGGEVWEIIRDDNPDALTGGLEKHSSEAGVSEELIDRVILNNGALADLDREVRLTCLEAIVCH